ncbi:hypothetical protein HC928_23785, partial [bacterium]|nr:hypothetical protein [bacterium]
MTRSAARAAPRATATSPFERLTQQHVDDVKASGVTALHVTVGDVGNKQDAFQNTIFQMSWFEREIDANPGRFLRVRRASDINEAKASGRTAVIYGFQDLTPLMSDITNIEVFSALGVRVMQLTYNLRPANDTRRRPSASRLRPKLSSIQSPKTRKIVSLPAMLSTPYAIAAQMTGCCRTTRQVSANVAPRPVIVFLPGA